MKNEMIMKAFESIHPDSAADARMLGSIMAYQWTYRRTRVNVIREYAAIAACLVLLLGAGIGVRYLGANRISVTLESGEMKKHIKWIIPLAVLVLLAAVFFIYTGQYYHADERAYHVLVSNETVKVFKTDYGYFFDGPSAPQFQLKL